MPGRMQQQRACPHLLRPCPPPACSSLVSLFGSSSSAKAINYSQMASQASAAFAAAQKGDYSRCLPLLGVSMRGRRAAWLVPSQCRCWGWV